MVQRRTARYGTDREGVDLFAEFEISNQGLRDADLVAECAQTISVSPNIWRDGDELSTRKILLVIVPLLG